MPTFFVAAAAGAAVVASLLPHSISPSLGAEPSTVWIVEGTLYFDAAERTINDVSIEPVPGVSGQVLVRDASGTPIRPADPCVSLAANVVRCPSDRIEWTTTVLRGEDDQFDGGVGNDKVYAGPGNDKLRGGPGNDHLYGQTGDDFVNGGSGFDYANGGDDLDTCIAEVMDECE